MEVEGEVIGLAENLLNWPVVGGALTCPVCAAPAVEERVPGTGGPTAAYAVKCTQCWKAQCTDPTSLRWKNGWKK